MTQLESHSGMDSEVSNEKPKDSTEPGLSGVFKVQVSLPSLGSSPLSPEKPGPSCTMTWRIPNVYCTIEQWKSMEATISWRLKRLDWYVFGQTLERSSETFKHWTDQG